MRIDPATLRAASASRSADAAGRRPTRPMTAKSKTQAIPTGFGIAVVAALVMAQED